VTGLEFATIIIVCFGLGVIVGDALGGD